MTYAPSPRPTPDQWRLYGAFVDAGSVRKAAFSKGVERREITSAVTAVRWWRQDSGWSERYALAKQMGFSDADARLHADQEATYNEGVRMARTIYDDLDEIADELDRRADVDAVFAEKCSSTRDRATYEIRAQIRREDAALVRSAELK